ncbi:MAG: PilZ domain-containing protein [Desulfosarcina sp.]|nr:PilZ domain-containing protein [Desulfobacterales bacterium]
MRALLYGKHERYGELQNLTREGCLKRPPRRFRAAGRRNIHFNLLLSPTRRFDAREIERTVTVNISQDGCFIFTSARFQKGQRVWIRIMEIYDKTPIACIIRHKRKWGHEMAIPGIGVRFESLTDAPQHVLAERCAPSS